MNWYKRQLKMADFSVKWTEDQLDKIKGLIENKTPFYQIAKMFNVSKATILRLNKRYKWRDIEKERYDYDNNIANMYRLPPYGKGMGVTKITKETGITHSAIYNALKRLGFEDEIRSASYENKKRWSDPLARELASKKQKQVLKERPELKDQISETLKQFHTFNPESAKDVGQILKQKYIDDPTLREERAIVQKQRYIDNPQLRDQISKRRKKEIADIGGFEGMLINCSTKEKAIAMLNHNLRRMGQEGNSRGAFNTYNKYMEIINNHTFPNEVQQEENVTNELV